MPSILLDKVTKSYGKARGIVDVSLDVPEQDFFGFVGPNGAGKSTAIRLILGLLRAQEGKVRCLGHDPVNEPKQVLSNIGYVPAESNFYPKMKVKDLLRMSADLRNLDCQREGQILCDRLSLDPNRKIAELSLGNRKKVSLVAALQHKPQLYILDEPTSGLDPIIQNELFNILKERNQEGATIFLSSHNLDEVQRHCKRAAIVREGRIVREDTISDLLKDMARWVDVYGVSDLPLGEYMSQVSRSDSHLRFLYTGSTSLLLERLTGLPITDLKITDPSLEEIFLHYYQGD